MNEPQSFLLQMSKAQLFDPVQDWLSTFELPKNHPKKLLNPDSIHLTTGAGDSDVPMKKSTNTRGGKETETERVTT